VTALLALAPSTYAPHALHAPDRLFPETNCYTDLWIELLHARGEEPLAMLAFTLSIDFEGDQWTFFKPPPEALERLYGLEVQEFVVYRPLPDHLVRQSELGRTVIVEADAYYLPDTKGRSYREQHEKSSIAVASIDVDAEQLVYFHNGGLFELSGDDFRNVLRLGRPFSPDVLAPYIELVRSDRLPRPEREELRTVARELLTRELARRPSGNPVRRFGDQLSEELIRLGEGGASAFHEYAFVTVRQCGAAWELAQSFAVWLADDQHGALEESAVHFGALAAASKTLLFKLARAAATGRPLDAEPAIDELSSLWERALDVLEVP